MARPAEQHQPALLPTFYVVFLQLYRTYLSPLLYIVALTVKMPPHSGPTHTPL